MNNLYNNREKGCTPSKGKVFDKSEDTSHRFGMQDKRSDKGMVNSTTDNLAANVDDMMTMYIIRWYVDDQDHW